MRKTILTVLFGLVCSTHFVAEASAQSLTVAIPQHVDPLIEDLKTLTIPPNAPSIGMWSPPPVSNPRYSWPLVAMHCAVMPDGKVVTFGSPLDTNTFTINGEIFDIWNPRQGFTAYRPMSHRTLDNVPNAPGTKVDSFCAASILLQTGELLTSGGNSRTPNDFYNNATSLLNTARNTAAPGVRMASSRYYATQTMLPDGRALITGGTFNGSDPMFNYQDYPGDPVQNHNFQMSGAPEVYTVGAPGGSWDTLAGAASISSTGVADAFGPRDNRWWYPRQWVAPADGKVFGLSTHQMWFLDPAVQPGGVKGNITVLASTFKSGVGTIAKPNVGPTSTAVMYDVGKILQVGGNGRLNADLAHDWTPSSPFASVFDINTPGTVTWHDTPAPMHYGRQWANATVLPDGRVVVTGGTATGDSNDINDPNGPVHAAEIWNPVGESWTIGPSASVTRVYHSTAVLLPNGTVLTAGSGGPPGWPSPNEAQYNAEVYYPPYLFQSAGIGNPPVLASRPRILSMNARKFNHGATIAAEISAGQTITKAVLIGLGATTHGFDMGQRLYPAPSLTHNGTQVSFTVPDVNKTPPGYYYLFVSNSSGVPSEGIIVAIGANVASPPPRRQTPLLDYDGDGLSDLMVVNPSTSMWSGRMTGTAVVQSFGPFGGGTQVPFAVDTDGDGKVEFATWDPISLAWYVGGAGAFPLPAVAGDKPIAGDIDGDGHTDLGIMRPSTSMWYVRSSVTGLITTFGPYGGGSQVPFLVDAFGSGSALPATWDPATGTWYVYGYASFTLGSPGDAPVIGDVDGDGRTDFGAVGPSTSMWNVRLSGPGTFQTFGPFGGGTQVPMLLDLNGDGIAEFASWDGSSGLYHVAGIGAFILGSPGDVPVRPSF